MADEIDINAYGMALRDLLSNTEQPLPKTPQEPEPQHKPELVHLVQITIEFELTLRKVTQGKRLWPRFWKRGLVIESYTETRAAQTAARISETDLPALANFRQLICSLLTESIKQLDDPRVQGVRITNTEAKLLTAN